MKTATTSITCNSNASDTNKSKETTNTYTHQGRTLNKKIKMNDITNVDLSQAENCLVSLPSMNEGLVMALLLVAIVLLTV